MEVTAAVKNSTYTEGSTLTDKINRYILSNRASIASIAKEIGYSRTTVSRYLAEIGRASCRERVCLYV